MSRGRFGSAVRALRLAAFAAAGSAGLIVSASGPAQSQRPIRLFAVGDILLTRGIERKIAKFGERYPFAKIAPTLRLADYVIGNLECSLSERPFATDQQYRFRADPREARLLRDAGIFLINLANNHAMDCGPAGLADTVAALRAVNIGHCGLADQVSHLVQIQRLYPSLRVALLGFSDFPPANDPGGEPSVAYARDDIVSEAVRAARKKSDVVVVSFHWGQEQQTRPTARQRHLARIAADAGADLILGHHPHVLQGFEVITGKGSARKTLVAYSLGNFLFDGHKEAEKQSLILRCTLGEGGLQSAVVMPVIIEHSAPRPAHAMEAATILKKVRRLSAELGTRIVGSRIPLTDQDR